MQGRETLLCEVHRVRDVSLEFTGVWCKVEKHSSVRFIGLETCPWNTGVWCKVEKHSFVRFIGLETCSWNLLVFGAG